MAFRKGKRWNFMLPLRVEVTSRPINHPQTRSVAPLTPHATRHTATRDLVRNRHSQVLAVQRAAFRRSVDQTAFSPRKYSKVQPTMA